MVEEVGKLGGVKEGSVANINAKDVAEKMWSELSYCKGKNIPNKFQEAVDQKNKVLSSEGASMMGGFWRKLAEVGKGRLASFVSRERIAQLEQNAKEADDRVHKATHKEKAQGLRNTLSSFVGDIGVRRNAQGVVLNHTVVKSNQGNYR